MNVTSIKIICLPFSRCKTYHNCLKKQSTEDEAIIEHETKTYLYCWQTHNLNSTILNDIPQLPFHSPEQLESPTTNAHENYKSHVENDVDIYSVGLPDKRLLSMEFQCSKINRFPLKYLSDYVAGGECDIIVFIKSI
ncbi:hypothetical protein GJ496_006784 [Pomphorhynchus laevis]|nr:hypothetical protein GJ496_006784 [Pomphorhynchus laevis]